MKLPCAVIQDLLPLYAEDLTSDVSRTLVEEHLPACADCRKQLEELKAPMPQQIPCAVPMQQVRTMLKKQLWLAVLLTVCVMVILSSLLIRYLLQSTPLPYSEDLVTIQQNEDGSLDAVFNCTLDWAWYENQRDSETGTRYIVISCEGASPLYRWATGKKSDVLHLTEPGERCDVIYYENNAVDGEHIRIWGAEPAGWGHAYTLPRLTLNYYVVIAGIAALLCGLFRLLLRRCRAGRFFAYAVVFFLCYGLGHLLIVGNAPVVFNRVTWYFVLIWCCAAALFGAFCSVLALRRLHKDQ